MDFTIRNETWAKALQAATSDYMDYLHDSMWCDESHGEDVLETESGQPFDGCDTCFYREVISFLAPRIIAGYKSGYIDID